MIKAILTLVLFGAVGFGAYTTFFKKDSSYQASEVLNYQNSESASEVKGTEETISPTEPFTMKGTFSDLSKKGGSYECTVSHNVSVAQSKGTVYVSGSKIRGEFASTVPQVNMTVNSTMISDGSHIYTWTDMAKTGFKAKIVESAKPTSADSVGNEYMQNLEYSCNPWPADESKFAVPTEITFIDTNK
ncbi:MAG: hypothetical protein KBC42_01510 [Candidatus Pacebacteria bacterium]|nr:hypothetical protein [Candidatus Paceibacterota bacterium]MBP9780583.1 hypothetical protein [Candidatus Paceibacterota bacterium]